MMTPKRLFITFSTLLVAMVAFTSTTLAAESVREFTAEMQQELRNNVECENGELVVNVRHNVTNGIDSGFYGYWAYGNYAREIRVYDHGDNSYCAITKYVGEFDAVEGQNSPGAGETLDGDEDGIFRGGYWGTITGSLKETPDYPISGHIGSFDHACDIMVPSSCNNWNWLDAYFDTGYSFSYGWWGWVYQTHGHGWWINASTGSSGDIS